MYNSTLRVFTLVLMSTLLLGCAHHQNPSKTDANQFVTEFYAWVDSVETVEFDSDVDENVLIGATHGAISGAVYDTRDAIRGAVIGGFLAGLITALFEGDNTGYQYQLSAVDGDQVTVLSQHEDAFLGDCVRVRVAGDVTLSPVAAELCVQ